MQGFTQKNGKIAVMLEDNVDTDRIIPARFLSMVSKAGYGELVFKDVRGADFVLDSPTAKDASVLVVGTNFGCGSSREHAVWAIQQAGFVCVIARNTVGTPGFSDIFRSNAANCGLLLIELSPKDHDVLVNAGTGAEVNVNLVDQYVQIDGNALNFEINGTTKMALMAGLDLIGTTMSMEDAIDTYEQNSDAFVPATA